MLDPTQGRTKPGRRPSWSSIQVGNWTLPRDQPTPTVNGMRAVESQIRADMIDTMMDLYCEWRTEAKEVQAAYERISWAEASDRVAAFAAYLAALDREESACRAYDAYIRLITSHRQLESGALPRRREGKCP
jgi:hypothetical protein